MSMRRQKKFFVILLHSFQIPIADQFNIIFLNPLFKPFTGNSCQILITNQSISTYLEKFMIYVTTVRSQKANRIVQKFLISNHTFCQICLDLILQWKWLLFQFLEGLMIPNRLCISFTKGIL